MRRVSITFVALLLLPAAAHAGDDPVECHQAELTLDGRYVLMRPGCEVGNAFDLTTGQLAGRKRALAIAKDAYILPLRPFREKSRFGEWMTRQWEHGAAFYRWNAFTIPGTDWVLRYKVRSAFGEVAKLHGRAIQYAPARAYREVYESKKRRAAPKAPGDRPRVGPFGTSEPGDLTAVFVASAGGKDRGKTSYRAFTYDPATFKRLVPTFGDFIRHAKVRFKNVRSESGSTGWRVVSFAPKGFWAALGFDKPGFRIVDYKRVAPNDALHALYEGLAAGKRTAFRTFRPYHWTVLTLTPKAP